ncbi:mannose-1-phosphate guanylyltransferase [bacterium]|nr:mannose-1-phosphate guanylyltransferase [bacterium]
MYCVIMAGGSGTRFWPRSREGKSKQFLSILSKKSLIQSTLERFRTIVPWENVYVVAKKSQQDEIEKHVSKIPSTNVIYEPVGKNTAPCIGLAAIFIQRKDPNGIMVVSPADHLIKQKSRFSKTILSAVQLADQKNGLITIGIPPGRPATGYGYIQIDGEVGSIDDIPAYKVKTFAEKPNLATAQRFLNSGDFLWNSGLFIFKVSIFLKALKECLPELYHGLMKIKRYIGKPQYENVLMQVYRQIESISIDYGVMEKIKNVYLMKGEFFWNDMGNWEQVYQLSMKDKNGNVLSGDVILLNTKNSFVSAAKGVVAVIGCEDVVVVQEKGATLVCKQDHVEHVKTVVQSLKRKKLHKYI